MHNIGVSTLHARALGKLLMSLFLEFNKKQNEKNTRNKTHEKKTKIRKKRRYAINVPYPLNVILLDIAPSIIRQTTPAD